MATISLTVYDANSYATYFTLTYSVSSSNSSTTVSVSYIEVSGGTPIVSTGYEKYSVTVGGTTISSGTITGGHASISGSKTISAEHSSQFVQLVLNGITNVEGTTRSGSSSVRITIPAKTYYTVSYNANGGVNIPQSQTKWYGEDLKLSTYKPSRTNYQFYHWNTNSYNTGTSYSDGATYRANASATLYAIWNPIITYNSQGGGGTPAPQTKTYGVNLTLSSQIPTKANYAFLRWNTKSDGTGTSYSPSSTYSSNTATTLYAIWHKVGLAPTISSMSVVRCDENGRQDDGGSYCKLTASWSVDTSSDAGMSSNVGTVTGTIGVDGSSTTTAITFSGGTSGTSGTATALIPNCDTDSQYRIGVTVTNSVVGYGNTSVLSTTRYDILTRAFFTMDFASGGNGIGIGTAAPQNGFEVGFDTQFNKDVDILGTLTASNLKQVDITDEAVVSPYSNFTINDLHLYKYGRLTHLYISCKNTSALTAGSRYSVCVIKQSLSPVNTVGISADLCSGDITSGGAIRIRPYNNISANTYIYIGCVYMNRGYDS